MEVWDGMGHGREVRRLGEETMECREQCRGHDGSSPSKEDGSQSKNESSDTPVSTTFPIMLIPPPIGR